MSRRSSRTSHYYTVKEIKSYCKRNRKTQCLEWQRAKNTNGYGVCIHGSKHWLVHRLMCKLNRVKHYKHLNGNVVLHKCDNPSCCNTKHLQIGTQKANVRDMHRKGRWRPLVKDRDSIKIANTRK